MYPFSLRCVDLMLVLHNDVVQLKINIYIILYPGIIQACRVSHGNAEPWCIHHKKYSRFFHINILRTACI